MKGHRGRRLSPASTRKELASLRAVWNWGTHMGPVAGRLANRGLVFPKIGEKPPFMIWQEIERRIQARGLTDQQRAELWDALFLALPEIDDLPACVRSVARHPWIYPMFVFAAHTGARRSEMIRAQGNRTTHRIPLSSRLAEVLREWLGRHPGGRPSTRA